MTRAPDPTADQGSIDQSIIEALVNPERHLLDALYRSGMTAEAVSARAAELCLTNEVVKRCRLTGTMPSMRPCLECDARFLSLGSHNRRCKKCRPR